MRSTLGVIAAVAAAAFAPGCGDNNDAAGDAATSTYTIGGTISGLTVDGLVLEDNGGDDLTVAANATTFVFATPLASGTAYAVTILTQPTGATCTITAGSGVATADVSSVVIACTTAPAITKEWTWKGGSDTAPSFGRAGVYGTLGTAAAANIPGGRQQSASWRDGAGDLWLFGGYGVDSAGNSGQLDDLWKLDPASGEWTWVSGTNVAPASTAGGAAGSPGVYGTLGTADAGNVPGGREQVSTWVDANGALWVFGGEGIDASGVTGELGDLWKFADNKWTWMGGSDSVGGAFVFGGPTGVYGTQGTADAANIPGGRYGAVQWIDAQGNFWLFGGSGIDGAGFAGSLDYLNDLWMYTPGPNGTVGAWTWVAGPDTVPTDVHGATGVYGTLGMAAAGNYPGGRDASTSWVDASGDLWIFGGIGIDSTGTFGFMNDLWKFSPSSGKWTWVNGSKTVGDINGGPSGVYGTLGTADAANVPGGRYSTASWIDGAGNLWLLGGQGYDSAGALGILDDLWKFDVTAGQWTWVSGSSTVGNAGGQPGVYGTLGTPDAANTPGGRFGIPSWTTASGALWLFGGLGYDSTGSMGYLDDLWSYQP
ncbi:MAG TPA: kelch repeat-containing protein [Kofleriaceae bacterium]|jgi:N-acetylneuraminic acid mutarotase